MTTSILEPNCVAAELKFLQGGGKGWAPFVDCVERRGFGHANWGDFETHELTMRRWRRLISEGDEEGPEFIPAGNGPAVVVVILIAICGVGGRFADADVAKAMRAAVRCWIGPEPFPPVGEEDWLDRFIAECGRAGENREQFINALFRSYLWDKAA